jgi:uncharacterized protein (TIGR02246 family)
MENKTTRQLDTTAEEAVKGLYKDLLNSWNQYSAAGYAELFMDNGSLVGFDGSQANSRQEIYNHLSQIFVHHRPASYVYIIREVRFVTPDVAILRAVAGMVPPGQDDIKPDVNAIQTMVAVKDAGEFLIAMFHNTPAAFHGRPEASEQLTAELREVLKGGL